MPDLENRPRRFFVSYRRRAESDSRLAAFLVTYLRDKGCEVFIDVEMHVGIDWSQEIDRRIGWCDFLVVLLSAESISSEMVQAEVRRAHRSPKPILPIRLAYTGTLGYELDGYLGKLQYALWRNPGDDGIVAAEILRAATSGGAFIGVAPPPTPGLGANPERPEPKCDMRLLREEVEEPGSALASDNPYYIRRDADERVEEYAKGKGRTLIIKAPAQTGKSSLLLRYLAGCLARGKRVAFIDFMTFGDVRSLSFPDFAAQFARLLLREFDLRGVAPPAFAHVLDLTNFLEDELLPRLQGHFVIALDEADRALGSSWQKDFYAHLRIWHSNRGHPQKKKLWANLDLAIVIATEPLMLIEGAHQSIFTVPPLELKSFARPALDSFNASYGEILSSKQLDSLFELLRGHPYLTPLAFYRLIHSENTFATLCADAASDGGPFGDHLRSKLDRLYTSRLHEAMREVVLRGNVPGNDRRIFYRLEAAGLVREEGGRYAASNDVYHRFFKAVL